MTSRERLPNRRPAETFELQAAELRYVCTIGRFVDGRLAEIFLIIHFLEQSNPMEKLPARPPEDRPRDRTEGAKAAREGCGYFEGG
jgi:hypothetical protein